MIRCGIAPLGVLADFCAQDMASRARGSGVRCMPAMPGTGLGRAAESHEGTANARTPLPSCGQLQCITLLWKRQSRARDSKGAPEEGNAEGACGKGEGPPPPPIELAPEHSDFCHPVTNSHKCAIVDRGGFAGGGAGYSVSGGSGDPPGAVRLLRAKRRPSQRQIRVSFHAEWRHTPWINSQ
jgi:hypothetical protein